jgi:hypothetical protein
MMLDLLTPKISDAKIHWQAEGNSKEVLLEQGRRLYGAV